MWTEKAEADLKRWYKIEDRSMLDCKKLLERDHNIIASRGAIAGRINKLGIQKSRQAASLGARPMAQARRSTVTNMPIRSEPAPEYKPKVIETPDPPLRKTLMQLKIGDCFWPVTDRAPHFFCGHRTEDGRRYCPTHTKGAYEGKASVKDLIRSSGSYR